MGSFYLLSAGLFAAMGILDIKEKEYSWATFSFAIVACDLYMYFGA